VTKLLKLADELVFSFDGDAAGRKAAWRALEVSLPLAADHKPIRFLFLPEGEDPDSYIRKHGKEAFERLVPEAPLLSEFLLSELRSQSDLGSAEGRAGFVVAAKPHIQRLNAPTLKLQLVKEVARLAALDQAEAEVALELRTTPAYQRPAPAKRRFQPPSSAEWKLLSRVACHPGLTAEVDVALLDETLAESQLLVQIRAYCEGNRDLGMVSNPMLIEHFRDSAQAELLFQAQAYGLELRESEADSLQFVRHTVWKLDIARKNKQIRSLEQRLRQGQLTKEEHRDYARMIAEVKALEGRLQAEARALSQTGTG
jgi:DNA primase